MKYPNVNKTELPKLRSKYFSAVRNGDDTVEWKSVPVDVDDVKTCIDRFERKVKRRRNNRETWHKILTYVALFLLMAILAVVAVYA